MCFGLTGPISGERSHLQAPRGAYFEHLSNTSSFQVLDCSNTSSCQSNSHPYPGNPCLTLDDDPWSDASASAVLGRPEFEEGKGRSGLLCQVLYSRTLDLERVRRGRLAVGRPEFEEGKGRSGLLVSSAGAVAAGNWIPMLKGGL